MSGLVLFDSPFYLLEFLLSPALNKHTSSRTIFDASASTICLTLSPLENVLNGTTLTPSIKNPILSKLTTNGTWYFVYLAKKKENCTVRRKKENIYIYSFLTQDRLVGSGASWTLISKISQAFKSRSVIECLFAGSRFRLTTPTQPTPLRSIDPIGRET